MAPRPSSPTSLLWAHQLKREHGHLLKRMQILEAVNEKHEGRIKTAENATKVHSSGDTAALAKEVKAFSEMEKNVTQKLDDVQAENEAMTLQIAALQKDDRMAEDERKKNLTKDKALLKRIGEVEDGLKKYEQSLDRIGRRINERQFEQIKEQLENLAKQVKQEGGQMKMLAESVSALETANAELTKANERLEIELRKASKGPVQPTPARVVSPVEDVVVGAEATPNDETERPKKKSHKWAGGGADRDIIRQGSGLVESSPIIVAHPPPKVSTAPKKPAPPPRKIAVPKKPTIKKKSAVPQVPGPSSDRKSHKWAGGGADRSIIAQGLSQDSPIKLEPMSDDEDEPPRKKARTTASGKAIIRSGKGWYEVARSPTAESQASSGPTKPGRGRPKKDSAPPQDSVTLGKRGRGRPRKYPIRVEQQIEPVAHGPAPRRTIQQNHDNAASKETTPERTHKEPNIFSSPVASTPPAAGVQPGSKDATLSTANPQPDQAPPRARRQIVQLDDDISAIVRQLSG